MAGAFRKVDALPYETRDKIEAILRDSEKRKIKGFLYCRWIYRKQGMSQSELI